MRCIHLFLCLTLISVVSGLYGCGGGGGGSNSTIPSSNTLPSDNPSPAVPTPVASSAQPRRTAQPTSGPSVSAIPSSTPFVGVVEHFPTMAFDEYSGRGGAASANEARAYVTYALGGLDNMKAFNDCSGSDACYSAFYFDPNFVYPIGACQPAYVTGLLKIADETWFMHEAGHTDSAHRLIGHRRISCKGTPDLAPVLAVNEFNPAVRAYIESYLATNADSWDYIFMDETSSTVMSQFYGPGAGMCQANPNYHLCSTTQEYPNDAAVVQAHDTLFSMLTHANGAPMKMFFNGINYGQATDITMIKGSPNIFGAVCEDCVDTLGKLRPENYGPVLDTIAKIAVTPNAAFIELNVGDAPSGSPAEITARTITVAIAWLGYSPGHIIAFPDLEYNSKDLAVWPEYNIVPAQPLESMTNSHTDLEVANGVYVREFGACRNAGTPIGQCAVIVNGNASTSVTVSSSWLKQSYSHIIQLVGGDISSGGQLLLNSATFSPATTTLAPGTAILLAR